MRLLTGRPYSIRAWLSDNVSEQTISAPATSAGFDFTDLSLRIVPQTVGAFKISISASDGCGGVTQSPESSVVQVTAGPGTNAPPDSVIVAPKTDVSILPGNGVTFNGSGSDPDNNLPLRYAWNFGTNGPAGSSSANPGVVRFPTAGIYVVTLTVQDGKGLADPTPATRTITVRDGSPIAIPRTGWSLKYADSEETDRFATPATNAFDGNAATYWYTRWNQATAQLPHELQINLGAQYNIHGFRYLPRQNGTDGRISKYEFYVSLDGLNWGAPAATGVFVNDGTEKQVLFDAYRTGQYVRLRALGEANNLAYTAVAELTVLTR